MHKFDGEFRRRQTIWEKGAREYRNWEGDINICLKYIGCKGMGWIELAQNKFQYSSPMGALKTLVFYRRRGNFLIS